MLGAWPLLLEASPLKRSLGFYSPLDRGLPLGPAVFFRDARIESVKPLQYLPTPLDAHRRVPFVPFFCAALTSALRSPLLEERHVRSPPTVNRARPTKDYTLQHASGLQECNIPVSIW